MPRTPYQQRCVSAPFRLKPTYLYIHRYGEAVSTDAQWLPGRKSKSVRRVKARIRGLHGMPVADELLVITADEQWGREPVK